VILNVIGIKILLKEFSNRPELIYESDENGNTALIYACRQANSFAHVKLRSGPNYEIVNLLLHYGANPNARNNNNRTALHYACRYEPKAQFNSIFIRVKDRDRNLELFKARSR